MAENMVEEMDVDLVENNSLVVEKNLRWLEFREVIAEVRHEIWGAIEENEVREQYQAQHSADTQLESAHFQFLSHVDFVN